MVKNEAFSKVRPSSLVHLAMTLAFSAVLLGCTASKLGAGAVSSLLPGDSSVSGVVSAGPLNAATVTVYTIQVDGSQGTQLGTTTTNASGKYSLKLDPQTGPVMIVAQGGSYVEESSGSVINMGSAQIRTLLPSTAAAQQVAVTPVTEIAAQQAISSIGSNAGVSMAALISGANAKVASAMGLSDITLPPADPTVAANAASGAEAQKYAVVLAAISQMAAGATTAAGSPVNSLDMMQALATAFTYNGNFSATVPGGAPIPVPNANGASINLAAMLTSVGGSTDFSAAMNSATTQYLASPAATNLGYSQVAPPVYVTAPPQPVGEVALTPPAPPATLPSASPTIAGPPPVVGQTPVAVPALTYSSVATVAGEGAFVAILPTALLANGGPLTGCALKSSSAALPSGLSVDPNTCFITGTAQAAHSLATYTVVASNSVGNSADATVSILIQPRVPHIYIADGAFGNLSCALDTATGLIGTCAGHTGGNYYAPFDFDYVHDGTKPSIMYVAGGYGIDSCAMNSATGVMSCGGLSGGLIQARKIRVHTNSLGASFAYMLGFLGVSVCPISSTTGYAGNCQTSNSGLTTPVAGQSTTTADWEPDAMDFFTTTMNSTFAYVLESHSTGGLYKCVVNNSTGLLSGCAAIHPAGMPSTFGITGLTNIKVQTVGANTYAYMALATLGIVKCTVDATTGDLSSCGLSNGGVANNVWYTTSIAFSSWVGATTYAYISDINGGTIYVCSVNQTTGALASCAPSLANGLSQPAGLTVF